MCYGKQKIHKQINRRDEDEIVVYICTCPWGFVLLFLLPHHLLHNISKKRNWRPLLAGRIVHAAVSFSRAPCQISQRGGWWINLSKNNRHCIIDRPCSRLYRCLSPTHPAQDFTSRKYNPRKLHSSADSHTTTHSVYLFLLHSLWPINFFLFFFAGLAFH